MYQGIVVVYSVDAVRDSDMSGDCKKNLLIEFNFLTWIKVIPLSYN